MAGTLRRWLGGGLVLAALALPTWQRAPVWQDEQALWLEATRRSPAKPRPWVNLGNRWADRGRPDLAAAMYQRAQQVARDPRRTPYERAVTDALVTVNLAVLRDRRGETDAAVAMLDHLLRQYPNFVAAADLRARWISRTTGRCDPPCHAYDF